MNKEITIIDYGMGNIGSIANMLKKVGASVKISGDPQQIRAATKLILPGVGHFDRGMQQLRDRKLIDVLTERVVGEGVPILGICLGVQLFTRCSEEGTLPGLGWVAASTIRFRFEQHPTLKIPHMGWNSVKPVKKSLLFSNLPNDARFYFVHSYHLNCEELNDVLGSTEYGYDFSSAIECRNIYGAQFHPEKSHKFGMALLRNFAEKI
jgi:glutamine amidotransferase